MKKPTYLDEQFYIDEAMRRWKLVGQPDNFRIIYPDHAPPPKLRASFKDGILIFLEVSLDGYGWIKLRG